MGVERSSRASGLVVGGLLLGVAATAIAHHASGPFYDATRVVEVQGKITKFVFVNPHAFLYVEAAGAGGAATTEWQIELGAPISLRRTGWTPETLKPGMIVKVSGQPSRAEGTHGICCARITTPEGQPVAPGARLQEEQQPPR
jgi:hypothetical protein